ncbi:MAG: PilC/PilY family type IV pilus protein [Methylococcaceae bacterium]
MKRIPQKLLTITSTSLLTFNIGYAGIAQTPLHLTAAVNPNVLLNMSVEVPMGGAAYNDQAGTLANGTTCGGRTSGIGTCYFSSEEYLGYFDPEKCYSYHNSDHASDSSTDNPTSGYFYPHKKTESDHSCQGGGKFSGNFMNWATMTAVDMFVVTMTGGNRVVDTTSETIIRRARKQNNDSWYPYKRVATSVNVSPNTVTPFSGSDYYIYNTSFGVQFGTTTTDSKSSPTNSYNLKIKACDPNVITGDTTASLEDNCTSYGDAHYKPEGLIQDNSDNMRFAITSYLFNSDQSRDGGVLRANMKYTGILKPDGSGGKEVNTEKEVNEDGTLVANPNPTDAIASSVSKSGVINFINQFSNPGYKGYDPVSELFYETVRYFKNLGPTPEYSSSLASGEDGGFPVITNWQDPIEYSCQKNFIVAINDAFPWLDKKLPGTTFTSSTFGTPARTLKASDYGEPSNSDASINVTTLTNTVGTLEGLTSLKVGCTASDCDMSINNKSLVGSGLGEILGTPTWAGRENSYYVAGLAYYANTQDLRSDIPDKQTVRTFMIDTQEYNSNPPLGPLNMLWLTGKYGGFVDANGDNDPNDGSPGTTTAEWDADGDGEPDNYVLANRPDKMVNALKNAFDQIEEADSSVTALNSNSTSLSSTTRLYQARFNNGNWEGDLWSYSIDSITGSVDSSPVWKASEQMPGWNARNIFTYDPALLGNKGIKFRWANISSAQKALLEPRAALFADSATAVAEQEKVLEFIRGHREKEKIDGGKYRDRPHFGDSNSHAHLGDIVNSSPAYVSYEYFGYDELSGSEGNSYATFQNGLSRTPMLYVGANDGMLHGFNAVNGQEKFAYIPNTIMGDLKDLADPLYTHQYFVDASPRVADAYFGSNIWKTVLVNSLGAGGKAVFALDVTDPDAFVEGSFDGSKVLWELSNTNDVDIGHVIGQASIVRLKNGSWAAIFGNGFESNDKGAKLFIVDIATGAIIKKFDTKSGDASNPNGLSTPISVDSDGDRIADVIYAGDLQGHLWKFDVNNSDPTQWKIAFGTSTTPEPLFRACNEDPCVNPQAITAKPQVGDHPSGGLMVYFGTGKFFETGDNMIGVSPQVQTYYAIRDNHDITDTSSLVEGRDELQAQVIESVVVANGSSYRGTSNEEVDYYDATTPKYGWYLDLLAPGGVSQGERVISESILMNGRIIFVTFIPNPDPCATTGNGSISWLMEMDAISGGPLGASPFDVDNDDDFDDDDNLLLTDTDDDGDIDNDDDKTASSGTKIDGGTGQNPVILETTDDNRDKKYFSEKSGGFTVIDESAARKRGRQTWLQF